MDLPNPVIRSHYRNGFIKQYVRDHLILRTEPTTNNVTDYGVNKAIDHLPALRDKMAATINNYLDVQQDILEAFVDRGQLRNLAQPTLTATGKRIPGLKLDNPRQLALMHALVRFAQIPAARTFSTAEIYPHTIAALGATTEQYRLASLRYDLFGSARRHARRGPLGARASPVTGRTNLRCVAPVVGCGGARQSSRARATQAVRSKSRRISATGAERHGQSAEPSGSLPRPLVFAAWRSPPRQRPVLALGIFRHRFWSRPPR